MSDDILELPKKKKSPAGKIAAAVVILALAGAGAWFFLSGDTARDLVDTARQRAGQAMSGAPGGTGDRSAANGAGDSAGNLPVQDMAQGENPAGAPGRPDSGNQPENSGNVVQPPEGAVSPEIVTDPEPGTQEPESTQSSAEARLAQALAEASAAGITLTPEQRAQLSSASGTLNANGASDGALDDAGAQQDAVVTQDFIRNLARWLVAGYQPSAAGKSGFTTASVAGANIRYGSDLQGLRHLGNDPVRGRAAVLDYVYSPGMLDALYRLYIDRFMAAMLEAAKNRGDKPALTGEQTADMFAVYAGQFRLLGSSLRGLAAMPDLPGRVAAVHRASEAVVKAHGDFAEALFAFEEARDAGRATDALRQRLEEASRGTERAIQGRAAARRELADAVKTRAGGRTVSEDTLVYMAEWVNRRGADAKTTDATDMAALILFKLADQCTGQSTALGALLQENPAQ